MNKRGAPHVCVSAHFLCCGGWREWAGPARGGQLDGVASNSGKDDGTANRVMISSLVLWRCPQQLPALCLNNFIVSHSNPESKLLIYYFHFMDVESELRKFKKLTGPRRCRVAELGCDRHPFAASSYPPREQDEKRAASRRACRVGTVR